MPWEVHRTEDGKEYYYDPDTRQSTWDKPAELWSAIERAMAQTNWSEYEADDGAKYWFNSQTNESVWELPQEVKDLADKLDTQASAAEVKPRRVVVADSGEARVAPQDQPVYESREDEEQAFNDALKRAAVTSSTSWDEVAEILILDQGYWAIRRPLDRKILFEQFIRGLQHEEYQKLRSTRQKQLEQMLSLLESPSHQDIKFYSKWATFKDRLTAEPKFNAAELKLQRFAFHTHVEKLRIIHDQEVKDTIEYERGLVVDIFKHQVKVDANTPWSSVQQSLEDSGLAHNRLPHLTNLEILEEFEKYAIHLQRIVHDEKQLVKKREYRVERKRRMAFLTLLEELRTSGKIRHGTKWPGVFNLVIDNPAFTDLCGMPGSSPLDLFWDVVEREDREFRIKRELAVDILATHRIVNYDDLNFDKFAEIVRADPRSAGISSSDDPEENVTLLHDILATLVKSSAPRRSSVRDEDIHADERRIRRLQDDLRVVIKQLEPLVRLDDSWDEVRRRIEDSGPYVALGDEVLCRQAFERHIRRLKEKELDERDRARERDRDRDRRRYDQERMVRNDDLRRRPSGRGTDRGPHLEY